MKPVQTQEEANLILIPVGGPKQFWHTDEELSIEKAYEVAGIDRGYIQLLELRIKGQASQMLIHEEGKLRGLPFNEDASRLFWDHGSGPLDDYIVGPALILTGQASWT